MNMVLILIPLLLLSIVFVEITIIDVQMAKIGDSSQQQNKSENPPPKVEIMITTNGFLVRVNSQAVSPIEACAGAKETVCIDTDTRDEKKLTSGYRWHELYNLALTLKNGDNPKWPNKEAWAKANSVDFVLDEDIPFGVLVKTMDTVRFKRRGKGNKSSKGEIFASAAEFDTSKAATEQKVEEGEKKLVPLNLFRQPMLGQPVLK